MRSTFRKKHKNQIRFGEKGVCGVKLVDVELPHETRGAATGVHYLWQPNGWPLWVDRRDVPGLAKELGGYEHLEGRGIDELKERREATKAKRRKRKAANDEEKSGSTTEDPAQETEEVDNA